MAERQFKYRWDPTWGDDKPPADSHWYWAMTALIKEVGTPRVVQGSERGVAGTREEASHKVEQEYRKLRTRAVSMGFMLKEPPL